MQVDRPQNQGGRAIQVTTVTVWGRTTVTQSMPTNWDVAHPLLTVTICCHHRQEGTEEGPVTLITPGSIPESSPGQTLVLADPELASSLYDEHLHLISETHQHLPHQVPSNRFRIRTKATSWASGSCAMALVRVAKWNTGHTIIHISHELRILFNMNIHKASCTLIC